jgi:hypothetical protein
MRLRVVTFITAVLAALAMSAPAAADHDAGPCNESGEPGHSDYAEHHIVPQAQEGMLGAGGHVPGQHRGMSACSPEENRP